MWEAQRDGVRAGAVGESSDVPQAHKKKTGLIFFVLRNAFLLQLKPQVDFQLVLNTCQFFKHSSLEEGSILKITISIGLVFNTH